MKVFEDYITAEFLDWLKVNSLIFRKISDNLFLIYKSEYCIKIYDRIGHGYGVNINISMNYDESIYEGDTCSAYWVYKYFGLTENANFENRSLIEYQNNLPQLLLDLKCLICKMEESKNALWDSIIKWINEESVKKLKSNHNNSAQQRV
jgi:hypothetical protein